MSLTSRFCFAVVTFTIAMAFLRADRLAAAEATEPKPPEFIEWRYPVGFSKSSDAETKKRGKELTDQLHTIELGEGDTNPVCCLWLEVSSWLPNPGQPGYVIVIQRGGGKITATSSEQLKLAIAKLISLSRKLDEHRELPLGLITNYPIFTPQKDTK